VGVISAVASIEVPGVNCVDPPDVTSGTATFTGVTSGSDSGWAVEVVHVLANTTINTSNKLNLGILKFVMRYGFS